MATAIGSQEKPLLFLSHISDEAEVAAWVKGAMETDFFGQVGIFTSSDISSIHAGEDWLDAVQAAMEKAAVVVVLCSKASIDRPWVQFEVGAAWMKGVRIIPVCHSGMLVTDLKIPLSLKQGFELGTEQGLKRLNSAVSFALGWDRTPPVSGLDERLRQIRDIERRFRDTQVQHFERFIDILIPAPGRLERDSIPNDTQVMPNQEALKLFGFIGGVDRTWADILKAAQRTKDQRWIKELSRCIRQAGDNELFKPVQAVYHAEIGSFQPQLALKEVLPNGACRFQVKFVETVVAPILEVPNDFGLLATLLRLGLRFRFEVIKPAKAAAKPIPRFGNAGPSIEESLVKLRSAVEVIENDALSRGAENINREDVAALFDKEQDQLDMVQVQEEWDAARALLFRAEPPLTAEELGQAVQDMRRLNRRFMSLASRRFHEMIEAQWVA